MNIKQLPFIIAIGLISLASSCTKPSNGANGATGATGPAGPAGPSYTGAISGHVDLYDQYGSKVLSGATTAQISLSGGTAINPDLTGYYMFGGVTTGGYYITASNTGYGATMLDRFQFLSDTLNKDIKLSAIPSFSITTFSAFHTTGEAYDSLYIAYAPDTRARECIIFVNNTSTVGNTPANYLISYAKTINANTSRAAFLIPAQDLYDAGFSTGNTVYYAIYSYVVGDVSVYEDLTTGKNVYNSVSSPITGSTTTP